MMKHYALLLLSCSFQACFPADLQAKIVELSSSLNKVSKDVINEMLKRNERNPEGLAQIGQSFVIHRQWRSAQPFFEKLVELKPNVLEHHLDLWRTYKFTEQFDKALKTLKTIPENATNNDPMKKLGLLWTYGNTYQHLHEFDLANGYYQKVLEIEPVDNQDYWWVSGNAAAGIKKYKEAIVRWQKAVEKTDENSENAVNEKNILFRNLGHSLIKLFQKNKDKKYLDKAVYYLDMALKCNPHIASSYDSKGTALRKAGKIEKALEVYKQALEVDPEWANSYNNIGVCYRMKEDYENAMELSRKALKIRPNHAEAHFNIGKVYYLQGRKKEALEYYEIAKKQNEQDKVISLPKIEKYIERARKL